MSSGKSNPLARIPGVDTILGAEEAAPLIAKYGHTKLVQCIRDQLSIIRAGLQRKPDSPIPTASDLLAEVKNNAVRPAPFRLQYCNKHSDSFGAYETRASLGLPLTNK